MLSWSKLLPIVTCPAGRFTLSNLTCLGELYFIVTCLGTTCSGMKCRGDSHKLLDSRLKGNAIFVPCSVHKHTF